jgi:hypothetical protein
MRRLWLPLLLGLLLTAVLFTLGVIYSKSGGAIFSIIFFPFTSLLGLILPGDSSNLAVALGYTLFLLQYPLYGVILRIALDGGKFYKRLFALLSLHLMCSLISFTIYRQ